MKNRQTLSCPPPPVTSRVWDTAFTLAEVLITIGIIGIVAAITIPSLIAKYEKKQSLNILKKDYAVLQEAFKLAEIQNGQINDWSDWDNAETILTKYLGPNLKIIKNYGITKSDLRAMCTEENETPPTSAQYVWFSGTGMASPFFANNTASVMLANGSCLGLNSGNENTDGSGDIYAKQIFIDLNGPTRKPNMAGKDLFFFYINKNGEFKASGDTWTDESLSAEKEGNGMGANSCNTKNYIGGYVCAEKIMREGWEINY